MKDLSHSKNLFSFLLTISAIFMASCLNQNDIRQESIYKREILNYLNQLNTVSSGARTSTKNINDLVSALDFGKVEIYKLRTTEKAIIADLNPMESFGKTSKLKALFYLNANKVVRSRIVTFDDKVKPNDYDGALLSVLNHDDSNLSYSGKVSFYSPFQHLMFFSVFENGNLTVSGVAHNKKSTQLGGRSTDVCTDWYLVTTYYYTDGTMRTTQEYLYSTCDDGGDAGGGGGTSGCVFPASPSNNDTYEFTDWEGKCTKYQFDSHTGYWVVVQVTLPVAVVQAQRDNYSFLPEYPYNRQTVVGPDDLIYKYYAGSGDWEGEPVIVDGGKHGISIADITNYLKCLTSSQGAQITIYVDQPVANSTATHNGGDVGHAWFSITQTINGTSYTRMIGFYPNGIAIPPSPTTSGQIKDDSGRSYDVSLTMNVSASQLQNLLTLVSAPPSQYDLDDFNCTDYVIFGFSLMGITLPDTQGTWPGGGGSNPGNFGQDLRNYTGNYSSKNTSGGTCPAVQGTCN